jgi:hypothetical protein
MAGVRELTDVKLNTILTGLMKWMIRMSQSFSIEKSLHSVFLFISSTLRRCQLTRLPWIHIFTPFKQNIDISKIPLFNMNQPFFLFSISFLYFHRSGRSRDTRIRHG